MKRFLPQAVFAFFVLCFALHPLSPFTTHHLADPDDYMRLNEVANWLQGQGWYDLSVPRMSPGGQTMVHWSRLLDLPLALLALPFIGFFGVTNALMISSFLVPLIYFAILLTLLAAWEKMNTGKNAKLSCVFLLFAPFLLFNYTPGRVDHHGVQALIAGFGFYSLGRIILDDKGALFAALSALAFACGFWIGAEALPWAILFITSLGIAAAWQGGNSARNAARFGLYLPLFTTALIPAALPATEFSSRALSWFSPAYAIFAALAGAALITGWLASKRISHKLLRLAFYALCGIGAAAAFFALIPSVLLGPFADYDTFDATIALDNINEATPMWEALRVNRFMPITFIPAGVTFLRTLALPLIGIIASLFAACRTRGSIRLIWLAQGVFLVAATALTVFWQNRVGLFMEVFMLVPLASLQSAWWEKLRWKLWERRLFWAEITSFLALGIIPVLLVPALIAQKPLYPDLLLFPAARAASACPLNAVIDTLNDSFGLGASTHTIMNVSDIGPELMFTTKHNVVAGNFDVPGNADAFTFFHATKDIDAQAAAKKWNADLVLLCRRAPTLYLGKDYYAFSHNALKIGKDSLLHLVNTDPDQPLIERLIRGDIPPWLKPIEIFGGSDYLLFALQTKAEKK